MNKVKGEIMNEGTFELNEQGWYKPKNVAENDYLNDKSDEAAKKKYGLTYSVVFAGDAGTYLWTAQTPPEEGKAYYGHIQKTSGTSLRFKVDKVPDGESVPKEAKSSGKSAETEENIARAVALKAAVEYAPVFAGYSTEPVFTSEVLGWADEFLQWLKENKMEANHTPEVASKEEPLAMKKVQSVADKASAWNKKPIVDPDEEVFDEED